MATFGEIISRKRKESNLSQRELAAMVKKEDGQPISPQYLNDLEHNRRNPPPPFLIERFARALNIEVDILYHSAGELPPDIKSVNADEERVQAAYQAFRRALKKD